MKKTLFLLFTALTISSCNWTERDEQLKKFDDKVEDRNIFILTLKPQEKFINFSIGNEDHSIWIATSDSSKTITIRKILDSAYPFRGIIKIK